MCLPVICRLLERGIKVTLRNLKNRLKTFPGLLKIAIRFAKIFYRKICPATKKRRLTADFQKKI